MQRHLALEDRFERMPLVPYSRLVDDLRALGLQPGRAVMPHASVKAIGWIVGGPLALCLIQSGVGDG